ncbi:hypothetical protein EDE08_103324 [Bradyrhizobium sp. R2.2-H]|jgi:hypothetical protein|uniref:hypothetical protein n=1 Tax=Bradyrhizobium TaxID=374 RepID=UPI0010D64893|nr:MULTISPECIES: hypothetical protein [Bradyrhizobium]TCU75107.1 hypothetical protein EDE10_103323 [Bradyrhizobium sp. Y-H1]TCU77875.1 hypothetical protein EDE08_103324 [Bradyrhizobium sp. R2.2-H]
MTPKQTRQRDRRPDEQLPAGDVIDPDFDELDGADAEWCAWRWPTRERNSNES